MLAAWQGIKVINLNNRATVNRESTDALKKLFLVFEYPISSNPSQWVRIFTGLLKALWNIYDGSI